MGRRQFCLVPVAKSIQLGYIVNFPVAELWAPRVIAANCELLIYDQMRQTRIDLHYFRYKGKT